jgi:hypothetical protein
MVDRLYAKNLTAGVRKLSDSEDILKDNINFRYLNNPILLKNPRINTLPIKFSYVSTTCEQHFENSVSIPVNLFCPHKNLVG